MVFAAAWLARISKTPTSTALCSLAMRTASRIVGAFSGAALVTRWSGRRALGYRRSLSTTPAENWRKESDRKNVETAGITFRVRVSRGALQHVDTTGRVSVNETHNIR